MTEGCNDVGTTVADISLQMVTALSAEVAMLRERLEIVERLAILHGVFAADAVDGFQPDPELGASFKRKRKAFIQRVFGAMRADVKG